MPNGKLNATPTIARAEAIAMIARVREAVCTPDEINDVLENWHASSLIEAFTAVYAGVTNGFLSQVYETMCGRRVEVVGKVAELFACPCCARQTLTERFGIDDGGWDICRYCGWEDAGTPSTSTGPAMLEYRARIERERNYFEREKWKAAAEQVDAGSIAALDGKVPRYSEGLLPPLEPYIALVDTLCTAGNVTSAQAAYTRLESMCTHNEVLLSPHAPHITELLVTRLYGCTKIARSYVMDLLGHIGGAQCVKAPLLLSMIDDCRKALVPGFAMFVAILEAPMSLNEFADAIDLIGLAAFVHPPLRTRAMRIFEQVAATTPIDQRAWAAEYAENPTGMIGRDC